jgi:formylglycine-generating enzyme required for sulfatase activity
MRGIRYCTALARLSVVGMLGLGGLLAGCWQRGAVPGQSQSTEDRQAEEPPLVVSPFDTTTATEHRQAWAEHFGVSAEITNSIGMKLALIPPGEFMMGSPEDEEGRSEAEHQHRVRITKPLFLGIHEVTADEYLQVMGTENLPLFLSPTIDKNGVVHENECRFPVGGVPWRNANEFCRKLSESSVEKKAGRTYRLPTEAEWEYACRAGTTTPFHFGSRLNGRQANCDGNRPYGTDTKGPDLRQARTVGLYQSNAFGLFDMHGNASEWCQDWYDEDYYEESPIDDPQGPSAVVRYWRVFRGGSWGSKPVRCRSASRGAWKDGSAFRDIGFRVAADPPGGQPRARR